MVDSVAVWRRVVAPAARAIAAVAPGKACHEPVPLGRVRLHDLLGRGGEDGLGLTTIDPVGPRQRGDAEELDEGGEGDKQRNSRDLQGGDDDVAMADRILGVPPGAQKHNAKRPVDDHRIRRDEQPLRDGKGNENRHKRRHVSGRRNWFWTVEVRKKTADLRSQDELRLKKRKGQEQTRVAERNWHLI